MEPPEVRHGPAGSLPAELHPVLAGLGQAGEIQTENIPVARPQPLPTEPGRPACQTPLD